MIAHRKIMSDFLQFLNVNSKEFVLKGGTALLMCYNLDRFSEDIDLDAIPSRRDIKEGVKSFCKNYGVTYRLAKDTDTVKRFFIHYGGKKPLKVEISYRRKSILPNECTYINGILVYNIQSMAVFKLNAYINIDKIRDLYDIVFIFRHYINLLPPSVISQLHYAIEQKGLAHFDYIVKNQYDDLIDNNKLASDFLDLYFYLGFT